MKHFISNALKTFVDETIKLKYFNVKMLYLPSCVSKVVPFYCYMKHFKSSALKMFADEGHYLQSKWA